uniref:Fructokinase (EC) n=1 Tax=uncultured Thiotrichaceae bacterium TaxID=298394 RepID=A0A6S6U4W6_9GAMM|nr:MAG: Fructokinase (EC [uncultured Thiotrichaceae bacterium]
MTFVVCGEALFDVFVRSDSEKPGELAFDALVGGSPLNVAVGLSRLGQSSALLTGLSTDFFGERLDAVLRSENVSTDFLARKAAPTTLGFVQKDDQGVPSYAFYNNGAADCSLVEADIEVDLQDTRFLHVGSYTLVVTPTADTLFKLIEREAGKRLISMDPNIRPTVEPDMKVWQQRVGALLPLVDIIKVSDEDLDALHPGRAPEEVQAEWLAQGAKLVVLTMGGEGAVLQSDLAKVTVKAPKITVVDTVGAGDTFQTALLDYVSDLDQQEGEWHERLDAEMLKRIGHYAVTAAAITCSRQGADLPTKDEVQAKL